MDELYNLDKILQEYPITLIDTSSLSRSFADNRILTQPNGKNIVLEKNHEFRVELMKYIEREYPFFITYLVYNEYLNKPHYNYKKALKEADRRKAKHRKPLIRRIRDAEKEERKLIRMFEDKERVLEFHGNERILYGNFYERYHDVQNMYELSDVDVDLLISAAVLAQTRDSCALLSNDFGIVKGWGYFLKKEKLNIKQFGFFVREEDSKFKRLR